MSENFIIFSLNYNVSIEQNRNSTDHTNLKNTGQIILLNLNGCQFLLKKKIKINF